MYFTFCLCCLHIKLICTQDHVLPDGTQKRFVLCDCNIAIFVSCLAAPVQFVEIDCLAQSVRVVFTSRTKTILCYILQVSKIVFVSRVSTADSIVGRDSTSTCLFCLLGFMVQSQRRGIPTTIVLLREQ